MNDQTFNSNNADERRKMKNRSIIFLITTLIFLGTTIYLAADNTHKAKMAKTLNTEITESANRYADLDAKYSSALIEIESFKGKNAELDSILTEKEKSIKNLMANLNKEKKNRQLSEADYKKQLEQFNTLIADLNTQIEQLQQEKGILIGQVDSLGKGLTETQGQVTQLQTTNSELNKKVTVASLLIPTNIEATGVKAKSSGKEVETDNAKKAEQIKVCFDVPVNKVAEAGSKSFFVRIISPQGTTLAVQDKGSGILTAVESGEQVQYTSETATDYQQQEKNLCMHWAEANGFQEGKYVAQIYQDGYLVGTKEFELK